MLVSNLIKSIVFIMSKMFNHNSDTVLNNSNLLNNNNIIQDTEYDIEDITGVFIDEDNNVRPLYSSIDTELFPKVYGKQVNYKNVPRWAIQQMIFRCGPRMLELCFNANVLFSIWTSLCKSNQLTEKQLDYAYYLINYYNHDNLRQIAKLVYNPEAKVLSITKLNTESKIKEEFEHKIMLESISFTSSVSA